MNDLLRKAKSLANEQPEEALSIINQVLNTGDPDSDEGQIALFMAGYIMLNAERNGLAYHIFQRCAQLKPDRSEIYSNMGMCFDECDKPRALEIFNKAIQLDKNNDSAIANKALMYLQTGRPEQCISLCEEILRRDPTAKSSRHNMGLAKLMMRDWSGWKEYHDTLGVKHRERRDYCLPEWHGEPGQVLVYGEQGVGDEIMFASCLEDLSKTNDIVFDCDRRLESIFKRSFDFPIYGTRFKTETPLLDNHSPEYQVAIGQLPFHFRKAESDFPGKPYLKPDPERVKQWDAIMGEGLRIGVACKGGGPQTGESHRSSDLDLFKPLYGQNLICLDYKGVTAEECEERGMKYWERGVRKGADLEELLAIVANCDVIITVCTTLVYFAGALGKPCHVLVPDWAGYRYHKSGNTFPWYESVKLHRGNWTKAIRGINEDLHRLRPEGSGGLSHLVPLDTEQGKRAG